MLGEFFFGGSKHRWPTVPIPSSRTWGNYETYKEDLRKPKGIDADQPHRVAYKKLVRA